MTTITITINENAAMRLYDQNNKEIATYISRKGESETEIFKFLEENIKSLETTNIDVYMPKVTSSMLRAFDIIAFANKYSILQLNTYIYDPANVPANIDQLAAEFDQPIECEVKNIL